MLAIPRGLRRHRAAFTIIEMIVVMSIIATLIALLAAAAVRVMAGQQAAATDSTLEKVITELEKQWTVVIQQANKEAPPPAVITLAGGDEHRARVIWIKLRLKQEFPTTYAEARNPAPGYLLPKNAFKNLPAGAPDPTTESSACLLLSLTSGRGGMTWSADGTLGAGFLRDTDGDGVPEILDAWGKAIYFVRLPIPNANPRIPAVLNPPPWVRDLNPNPPLGPPAPPPPPPGLPPGMKVGTNDAQDPEGLLTNGRIPLPLPAGQPWASSGFGTTFGQLCHPVFPNYSWPHLTPFVGSAGPNKKIGDNDDRFSYRIKGAMSGGQR
jgi:prepilin-type N-terminal cleavage/methylation domain-containing protein